MDQTTTDDRMLMRVPEVARLLGYSDRQVYRMIDQHRIPVLFIPGNRRKRSIRVPRREFALWLERLSQDARQMSGG